MIFIPVILTFCPIQEMEKALYTSLLFKRYYKYAVGFDWMVSSVSIIYSPNILPLIKLSIV